MNILPKKSWHVRTKENIARVRRDEAKLAAEEKERQRRATLAEGEARNAALRTKWKSGAEETLKPEVSHQNSHVNFFEDLEAGKLVTDATNPEYEREKKEEKEKYEKQIGYLTYLGQDTVEATGNVSWYNKVPNRGSSESDTKQSTQKSKSLEDPLTDIRRYLGFDELKSFSKSKKLRKSNESCEPNSEDRERNGKQKKIKKKSKKEKCRHKSKKRTRRESSSSESETSAESADESQSNATVSTSKLEQLRAQRLKREREEQKRSEALLARIRGEPDPEANKLNEVPAVTQRYHSQYNPHIARQNKL
ncbi:leukocyte receptor cluster member 1 homolog [Periplaneta americana]|uniref:leukocyte receptor cluster member 1 homolog n=1 Tax=Periplaneta americana TaxID=6978 RepID=UPI0037E8CC30